MLDHLVLRPRIKPVRSTTTTTNPGDGSTSRHRDSHAAKSSRAAGGGGGAPSRGRNVSNRVFHTNALPLVVQSVVLAMYVVRANGLQYLVFALFAPKVYIVSLLATLNSRSPHGNGALDPIETFTLDRFKPQRDLRLTSASHPHHHGGIGAHRDNLAPVRVVVQHEEMIDDGRDDDKDDDGDVRIMDGLDVFDDTTLDGHESATRTGVNDERGSTSPPSFNSTSEAASADDRAASAKGGENIGGRRGRDKLVKVDDHATPTTPYELNFDDFALPPPRQRARRK
ncbi:hypothetical protein JCM3766R1_002202 [Sporobolomyces carnicolor]